MLVVLDTNILFSALISPHGTPGRIYEEWQEGRFTVTTCRQQLDEIRVASRYPKLRAILQPHLVGRMLNSLQRGVVVESLRSRHTAEDAGDAFLLDLADEAGADYLVTGDKRAGLLSRKRVGTTGIVTAKSFLVDVLRVGRQGS